MVANCMVRIDKALNHSHPDQRQAQREQEGKTYTHIHKCTDTQTYLTTDLKYM